MERTDSRGLLDFVKTWFNTDNDKEEAMEDLGVTWMLLPPYDIPGMAVVSGLLVENQGASDAEDVHISLNYPGERFITHMEVVSDDQYDLEGGTPRDSHIVLQLPQLRSGGKVVIYVAGHSKESPDVTVAVQAGGKLDE